MGEFKNKEEYEKWKTQKSKDAENKGKQQPNSSTDINPNIEESLQNERQSSENKIIAGSNRKLLIMVLLVGLFVGIGGTVIFLKVISTKESAKNVLQTNDLQQAPKTEVKTSAEDVKQSLDQTPKHLKEFVAYSEGNGVVAYFILADSQGNSTTSDGSCLLSIDGVSRKSYPTVKDLYSVSVQIKKEDFKKTKVGKGSFEHDDIIYQFPRIPYSDFNEEPFSDQEIRAFVTCTIPNSNMDDTTLHVKFGLN